MIRFLLFLLPCLIITVAFASPMSINPALSTKVWDALTPESTAFSTDSQEKRILGATLALEEKNPKKALDLLSMPEVQNDPLANVLKAEAHRLSALQALKSAGDYAKHQQKSSKQLAEINLKDDLNEATVRLQAFVDKVDGTAGYPTDLLMLNDQVYSVFLVDKARSRLFVYVRSKDGKFNRVADEYVVTGAKGGDKKTRGDARTPNGIYRFTSIRHDPALQARYGPVVFPINYPNALDKLHGKTGDGIWMHGYPENKKRRPPQDTRGCFALPNPILQKLESYVKPGQTWVVIGENFSFDIDEHQTSLLSSVQNSIQAWKSDWESLDSDAYLSHYHNKFHSGKYNLKSWKRYKKRVNKSKKYIRVNLANMTIIHDPTKWEEGEVVVAEFVQNYKSSNYADSGKKRLYLTRHDNQSPWKILIEESFDD